MCVCVYVRDDAGGDADGDREMPMEHERRESRCRAPLAARQARMAYMEERWLLATVDTKLACACVCISAVNQHP